MTRSFENTYTLLFWHSTHHMKSAKMKNETNLILQKQLVLGGLILTVYSSCIQSVIQQI